MDKDKIEIISRFTENTIENAKVISSDTSTIKEKVMARHSQGMNVRGAIFQMRQQEFKKAKLKIGGLVRSGSDDMSMVVEREIEQKILPRGEVANSITITVDTELTKDLHKKIYDAINL